MLSPYCVLDLTDEKGLLAGKVLADLGADVIKIEPLAGDPARKLGPFYHEQESPEYSLYWMAYNTSKRSITLNLEHPAGQDILRNLVKKADFVIESFPPGYLENMGIDYQQLRDTAPKIIWNSITPFGRTGPYKDYSASDLIIMAMGGVMFITGDEQRPPLRLALNQSYALAGIHCASACLTALIYRNTTGVGQHIDISIQEAVATTLWSSVPIWEHFNINEPRMGNKGTYGNFVFMREVWPCKDGYVVRLPIGGSWGAQDWSGLANWMKEDGVAGSLQDVEWATMDTFKLTQQQVDAWEKDMGQFFIMHTKTELEEGAARRDMRLIGVQTVPDIMNSKHLKARHYWKELEHPEWERSISYPSYYFQSSEAKHGPKSKAPNIGEHNNQVYHEKLGLSGEEIGNLQREGVI